ncbi:hypothetical protein [Sorangium sp. So ce693]|uniref:hypothetical protein n=1 Tax=Sorangium sp. So ce693 TaxID=3133318 RepID=UPI003F6235BF
MGLKFDKLLPLLPSAAPGLAAGVALVVEQFADDDAEERKRREAELESREAALRRREAELKSREAELARLQRQLAAEASGMAKRAAPAKRRKGGREATPAPRCPDPIWTTDEPDGKPPKLIVPERITYAWCVLFHIAPRQIQAQVSRQRRSQYRRVACMVPVMGEALDAAGVPFYALRFVAYGEGEQEQQRRFALMLNGERPPRELRPNERHSRQPAMDPKLKRIKRNRRRRRRRKVLAMLGPDSGAAAEVEGDVGELGAAVADDDRADELG